MKLIAKYFNITIDELLSNEEILEIVETDKKNERKKLVDIIYGLLNLFLIVFMFLPFFGYEINGVIYEVSLPNLQEAYLYILIPYYVLVVITIILGILFLCLQSFHLSLWNKCKYKISISLLFLLSLLFVLSKQPYAGSLTLIILIVEGYLLYKIK